MWLLAKECMMWKQLELLPRPDHTQAFLRRHFKGNDGFIASCFDRTSDFNSSFPYSCKLCGECTRRVVDLSDDQSIAICCDELVQCDDITIEKEETRVFVLSIRKTASFLAGDLEDANVIADTKIIDDVTRLIRVGFYMPRGTIRIPLFLGIPIFDGELDADINYLLGGDVPAILLLPSIENVPQAKLNAVKNKNSTIISLQDLQGDDGLIDAAIVIKAFKAFFDAQSDPDPEINCKLFPTPAGAAWEKFIFDWQEEQLLNDARSKKAHKREFFVITCGKETSRYEPSDLNMLNMKTREPTLQWVLLRSLVQNGGSIGWKDDGAKDNVKTQKKELIRKLKKAFSQEDDPIPWDESEKCYKCRFTCRSGSQSLNKGTA